MATRKECPVCGRTTQITVTGRLFKHRVSPDPEAVWCDNTSPFGVRG